jgi:hypothetical protein
MVDFVLAMLAGMGAFFRSRSDLALEILALRQQVAVLKRKRPRPLLNSSDRLFWTLLRQFWSSWKSVLIVVKPDTVVGWHRAGFRWYWRWKSRRHRGRPRITPEIRELIVRLAEENTGWGAPKIHGELLKLGFDISERTVARYLRPIHRRGDPKRSWLTFLNNHREVIVALDFFTVPTITFQLLYCFFVIDHQRRKILHCNVTAHPTADLGDPAASEDILRRGAISLRHSGSRCEVQCRNDRVPEVHGPEAETDELTSSLAKWNRRTLGRKCPPGDPRPCHRTE